MKNVVEHNLYSVFHAFQQALPDMLKYNEGRLIAVSSQFALSGQADNVGTCAAQFAVNGLVKALALELSQSNVTANVICPATLNTPQVQGEILAQNMNDYEEALALFVKNNPQQRLVECDEVFEAIKWLMSEGARSVTGQIIALSGGNL